MEIIIASIGVIISIATFIYVVFQTDSLKKDVKINALSKIASERAGINLALLQDKTLCGFLGLSKSDALLFAVYHDLEGAFLLWQRKIINESEFRGSFATLTKYMQKSLVKEFWDSHKDEFNPEFVKFVDNRVSLSLDSKDTQS